MRISDWSSDVCSSDLLLHRGFLARDDALLDEGAADGIEGMAVGAGKAHPLHAAVGEDDAARALDMEEEGIHRVSRSEERREGKECVSTCRSRWSQYHYKKKL